jgi:hypothetical protein
MHTVNVEIFSSGVLVLVLVSNKNGLNDSPAVPLTSPHSAKKCIPSNEAQALCSSFSIPDAD